MNTQITINVTLMLLGLNLSKSTKSLKVVQFDFKFISFQSFQKQLELVYQQQQR